MKTRWLLLILLLLILSGIFFVLTIGAVDIPISYVFQILGGQEVTQRAWPVIIETRLSEALVALFTGGALAVCGLILQGVFRNPLAGPGVLGISSGAYFGVAIFVFLFQSLGTGGQTLGMTAFGITGAFLVLLIIVIISTRTASNSSLLIAGLMLSYVFSSLVTILLSNAEAVNIQQFVVWGFGSFSGILYQDVWKYLLYLMVPLLGLLFLIQPLNALLLGENYASTLGIHVKRTRILLFLITGLIAGVATAYCGPIAFIGLATPHILRFFYRSNNYRQLIPLVFFCGALIGVYAHLFTKWPTVMPLNAITSFIGAPVVVYLLIKKRSWS